MDEIIKLQDEILSYLRDNITKDEAYYILTTDKEMIEVLISDKKDGRSEERRVGKECNRLW